MQCQATRRGSSHRRQRRRRHRHNAVPWFLTHPASHQELVLNVGASEWKVPIKSEMMPVAACTTQLVGKHEMTNTKCCEIKGDQDQVPLVLLFLAKFCKPMTKGPVPSRADCCVQHHARPFCALLHHVARTDLTVCQDLVQIISVNPNIGTQCGIVGVYAVGCHLKMERNRTYVTTTSLSTTNAADVQYRQRLAADLTCHFSLMVFLT